MGWRDNLPVIVEGNDAQNIASQQQGMTAYPGGQQDALRHALWNSTVSKKYGAPVALVGSGLLEAIEAVKALRLPKEDRQRVWDESLMDIKNNMYGAQNPGLTVEQLRSAPLESLPPYWGKKQGQ